MWKYQLTRMYVKRNRKGIKIQEVMYGDTTDVEHEMCDCAGNN
jgi:hypothetical protein